MNWLEDPSCCCFYCCFCRKRCFPNSCLHQLTVMRREKDLTIYDGHTRWLSTKKQTFMTAKVNGTRTTLTLQYACDCHAKQVSDPNKDMKRGWGQACSHFSCKWLPFPTFLSRSSNNKRKETKDPLLNASIKCSRSRLYLWQLVFSKETFLGLRRLSTNSDSCVINKLRTALQIEKREANDTYVVWLDDLSSNVREETCKRENSHITSLEFVIRLWARLLFCLLCLAFWVFSHFFLTDKCLTSVYHDSQESLNLETAVAVFILSLLVIIVFPVYSFDYSFLMFIIISFYTLSAKNDRKSEELDTFSKSRKAFI